MDAGIPHGGQPSRKSSTGLDWQRWLGAMEFSCEGKSRENGLMVRNNMGVLSRKWDAHQTLHLVLVQGI